MTNREATLSAGGTATVGTPGALTLNGAILQSGDFASVGEQAGIRAGDGGFGIRVAGATDLKGAVIASTAEAAPSTGSGQGTSTGSVNQLTTGTLTASAQGLART